MPTKPSINQQNLIKTNIVDCFNLSEFQTLCFELGVEYENLPGENTREDKSRELINYMQRHGRLQQLIEELQKARPQHNWHTHDIGGLEECPYRGLFAFREEDTSNFFGRETTISQLAIAVEKQSFVALVGPSGSGKSSVIFAGLVPKLRTKDDWFIASFRPGNQPFYNLASILVELNGVSTSQTLRLEETRRLEKALSRKQNPLPLVDVIQDILKNDGAKGNLLLIADQFEEIYTMCPDSELRHQFLDVFLESTKHDFPITIVITIRADFLGQALSYRSFADTLQNSDIKLGPMNSEELKRAITYPAQNAAVSFEPGLEDLILKELHDEPGNLPLLQFALEQLWNLQYQQQLTYDAYQSIGQVSGAIARHAETAFETFSPAEQEDLKQIFIQLVYPGANSDTRRLAVKEEFSLQDWELIQRLANFRLVVTDRDDTGQETAELVHESLIKQWNRLQVWLDEARTFRIWQERLRTAMHQWENNGRDESALLRGLLLAEAEGWFQEQPGRLTTQEKEYIQESIQYRDAEALRREALRQRELERARQLSELNKRLSRMASRLILPYLIFTLLISAFGTYLLTNLVTGSLRERFDNQMLDAGRITSEQIVVYEGELLEVYRVNSHTVGIAEKIIEEDAEALRILIEPFIINSFLDRRYSIRILNQDGIEIIAFNGDADESLTNGTRGNTSRSNEISTLEPVQFVLNGMRDEYGDKQVFVDSSEGYPILYVVGPIFDPDSTTQVGAMLVGLELQEIADDLTTKAFARITFYDKSGQVVATTLGREDSNALKILNETPERYLSVKHAEEIQLSELNENVEIFGGSYELVFGNWILRNESVGMYSVALPNRFLITSNNTNRNLILAAFVAVEIVFLAAGVLIIRGSIGPITKLVKGDFEAESELDSLGNII